jgi:Zn-dependent protease with chaperone function
MPYLSESYIHDMDRKAFAALNTFPKFIKLVEVYHANFDEKAARIEFLSSAIRLSDNQMPEIYNLLPPICEKLGIVVPELYYVREKEMNAATIGTTNPCIYVTSGLVKHLSPDLISSVLAHECGHIACKHYLYHSIVMTVINKLNNSPLGYVNAVRRIITPGLVSAFLFWDRCSELSADRAAALCDGKPEKLVDALIRIHGYSDINRDEFIRQAIDLHSFVNETKGNKAIEQMIVGNDTHPRLATRVYECCEWSKTDCFKSILNGTYTQVMRKNDTICEEEIVSAEIECKPAQKVSSKSKGSTQGKCANTEILSPLQNNKQLSDKELDDALACVNKKLERYTFDGDKADYSIAIASGIIAGMIDSLFVGEFSLEYANEWGNEKTEKFVLKVAKYQGYRGTDPGKAVKFLEDMFPIAADKATDAFGGGLQHHLRDFSHHPTPVGLACSILTQFTERVYGTDVDGTFKVVKLDEDGLSLVGKNFPEKITFGVVNWIFHMVSDVAGSSGSIMKGSFGTGLPGPLVSLIKELSALPIFNKKNSDGYKELSVYVSKLFNGTLLGERDENGKLIPLKFDLRTEMGVAMQIGKQSIPVIINECAVRTAFFLRRLLKELSRDDIRDRGDLSRIDWKSTVPFRNRTIDRMLMISSMTFTIADTADAAVHAAIESCGNWILFSGVFVSRFNYVGAGRAAIAIIKEVSNDKKEAQLIHEKMILTEAKTVGIIEEFSAYREALEERVSNYLAENLEKFLSGFDYMQEGMESGDSNIVIKGNVVIQKVLGREPQFTNQAEFDEFMGSDDALKL